MQLTYSNYVLNVRIVNPMYVYCLNKRKKIPHNSPLVTQTLVYQGLSKSFDIFSHVIASTFSPTHQTPNMFFIWVRRQFRDMSKSFHFKSL